MYITPLKYKHVMAAHTKPCVWT